MKPDESIEDFSDWFLHLYYEFPEGNTNWDFLKQNFECLVHISLHGESKPPDVSSSLTLVNRETPLISQEELAIPFVLRLPPFSVPMRVPSGNDVKVGKSTHQIPNPYSHPPYAFMIQIPLRKFQSGS